MGQQQLLLLVLSTVIVGLAAVAGIQAFDENQQQATQDAMVQRGTTIISDIKAELSKPEQLGGITYSATPKNVFGQLGYNDGTSATVPVEGASANVECELGLDSGNSEAVVLCGDGVSDVQKVSVTLNGSGNGEVSTAFGSNAASLPSGG
jgi:hypothetical protein